MMLQADARRPNTDIARRLGIQYIIWNRRIWSTTTPGYWRAYTGASPHTDHVHFSFGWSGAAKRTSYWTGRIAAVNPAPPKPVKKPAAKPVARPAPRPNARRKI